MFKNSFSNIRFKKVTSLASITVNALITVVPKINRARNIKVMLQQFSILWTKFNHFRDNNLLLKGQQFTTQRTTIYYSIRR